MNATLRQVQQQCSESAQVIEVTFGEDRSLACELLQHLGSTGQSVTALTNTDVQAQFANTQLPHGVLLLLTLVLQINQTGLKANIWQFQYSMHTLPLFTTLQLSILLYFMMYFTGQHITRTTKKQYSFDIEMWTNYQVLNTSIYSSSSSHTKHARTYPRLRLYRLQPYKLTGVF